MKTILVTGADGFVGRNLCQHLAERRDFTLLLMTRATTRVQAARMIEDADAIVHLAGVNRPDDPSEFDDVNSGLTSWLIDTLKAAQHSTGRVPLVIFSSSIQAELDNPYGRSKRAAEEALVSAHEQGVLTARLFRLPNVFGKWARPNYNSAVATFCYNIARKLPIRVPDPAARLRLVYVDDVVSAFTSVLDNSVQDGIRLDVEPQFDTTVGHVAEAITGFATSRESLVTDRVGTGLLRALYATYVSYLPTSAFAYGVPKHADQRGEFVEMLKTPDCGQFSYFSAHPGVTRGGHYHHTKTEKFLVLRGRARFRFRQLLSGEEFVVEANGGEPVIVESIPGWTHDVTNVGESELLVMLWANEIFDRARPDTVACPL